ncbi:MAG TPA: hydroxyethylthiazole kinase [Pseudolabrys sp.]|nr:hydroxyethylthiazole kinase [Pseudolabrys sp.]
MQAPAAPNAMAQTACAVLDRLRGQAPRVHCITNTVAQNFTANALLALGCVPSMTLSPEEIAGFVAGSDALLVNLGTFDAERRQATELAVQAARAAALPWVLDPVFVERSLPRAGFARALIQRGPRAVRLNRAEFVTLAGADPTPGELAAFARGGKTVVGLSGETDIVADGERLARIANGHPLMARVTAMGCAASAVTAACLAAERDAFMAAAAAMLIVGVAGEIAGEQARGPGSFATAMIDALYGLDGGALKHHARVTP